jgi:hypothetical protein
VISSLAWPDVTAIQSERSVNASSNRVCMLATL